MNMKLKVGSKKAFVFIVLAAVILGVMVGVYDSPQTLNTLPKGTYVIKNSSITKKISVL